MITRKCLNCGKEFKTYICYIKRGLRKGKQEGIFCNAKCRSSGKFNSRYNGGLEVIRKKCNFCKKEFKITIRQSKIRPANFCSRRCSSRGKRNSDNSYIYLVINGKRIAEHRFIMEKKLERKLTPKEVVHHKNHIRTDNRLENLMLIDSRSIHTTLHNLKKL